LAFVGLPAEQAWLMEIVGKGKEKGAVWVASRVPDGMVCSHANQARTRTFVHDDPSNVRYAKDVVTFAQEKGLYPKDAKAVDFSFSDVYDPGWCLLSQAFRVVRWRPPMTGQGMALAQVSKFLSYSSVKLGHTM
jgi:hypothetical protein